MSSHIPLDPESQHGTSRQTLSASEAARVLGFEQTTVYRLIWRGELRICAGTARYRIPHAEIERFLARTETYGERTRNRPKAAKTNRARSHRARDTAAHFSPNPHMIFIPFGLFGDRPVGERLMRTEVPDDETLPPETFIEVGEDEWNGKVTSTR